MLTSCSPEVDNYSSNSGKTDPSSIEKPSLLDYFPFESIVYSTIKSSGIDSSKVTFGTNVSFSLGQRGYCFQGDTINSYIKLNLLTNNVFQNLKEFTISSWIKVPAITDNRVAPIIMINGGDTISGLGSLSITFDSQYMKGYLYSDSIKTNAHEIKVDRSLIKENEWVHIAFTYNSSTSTMALYANGRQLKEEICYENEDNVSKIEMGSLNMVNLNMTNIYIGAWEQQILGTSTSSMQYFPGNIDEMRIWNKNLSGEEINSLYQAELSQAENK